MTSVRSAARLACACDRTCSRRDDGRASPRSESRAQYVVGEQAAVIGPLDVVEVEVQDAPALIEQLLVEGALVAHVLVELFHAATHRHHALAVEELADVIVLLEERIDVGVQALDDVA